MMRGVLCSFIAVAVLAGPALANAPTKKPAAAHKHKAKHKARAQHHSKHHAKTKTAAKP
jgi:hypothetical protein